MLDTKQFKKVISKEELSTAVTAIADRISKDYEGKPLVLIGVLKGAIVFMADLSRALTIDAEVDFVRLAHHGKGRTSTGTVTFVKDIQLDIRGKHVLIVEEIIDSGRTLKFLYDRLRKSEPASVEVVTLLDKKEKRLVDVPVRYVGIPVNDQFYVGYGLDLEEKNRNLSDVYALKYPN